MAPPPAPSSPRLREAYCGTTGYEFAHLRSEEERTWLQQAVEQAWFRFEGDAAVKRALLRRLTQVEVFEQFLHRTFPGKTWFSLEGTDMLIPLLDELIARAGSARYGTIVIGMPHRGRLNVLAHLFNVPYRRILAGFQGAVAMEPEAIRERAPGWMRDVEYHLGASLALEQEGGSSRRLVLHLLPNPSHVELVDPVVAGATRAFQERHGGHRTGQPDAGAALGILLHGDAAFAGQGIVAETLNLSGLPGYDSGGIIHIVVNNQIGFITEPWEAHASPYCTDIARGFDIPIVHVNGDDVPACLSAARLAFAYRQRFRKDVVIDLVGYRRFGHNEGDEPSFTQPQLYRAIGGHPTIRALWARRLVQDGIITPGDERALVDEVASTLQHARESLRRSEPDPPDLTELLVEGEPAVGLSQDIDPSEMHTSVSDTTLSALNEELHTLPEDFTLHPKLERPFVQRLEAVRSGGSIDWAHAESLAFASLLAGGVPVRLTGQDSERGTFSQRHAVLHDFKTGRRFCPLQALPSARAPFAIYNSPLSEEGVLGFEYGYSITAPETLVLWEAQYGDFVNNAQSILDEFIASAEAKWGQRSGIVLLLPHGYEGQGPNHSSAHLARVLELAAEENVRVACCTTAAQYFHLLRQQAARLRRDPCPLIVLTVKSLLRHPMAVSKLEAFTSGGFAPVLDDPREGNTPGSVERVVLCSGKVFVDLAGSEGFAGARHIAAVRLEQLYPLPGEALAEVLARYPRASEVAWLQEEPQNRGAWPHLAPQLERLLKPGLTLSYIGLPPRPSPAWGSLPLHRAEQQALVQQALAAQPVSAATGRTSGGQP